MPEPRRPLKIFLSYASQDKPLVRELSRRLVGEGWIDTWQDEKSLLPGQDWRIKIEEAVEDADVVIIVLSQNSVTKEGHVQKELRYAREIALEKPEDAIFLIPLRLDECEVPRGLRFYQWVDYFGDNKDSSYKALVASLNLRYMQKIKSEEAEHLRKELQEIELAEKIAREKAEKETAEKARLKVGEVERQRIAKEKADREAADKLAREKAKKEAAEKARLLAEEKERQKIAKEKVNRDQKIKETRPKKEHEPSEKARSGSTRVEKANQLKKDIKPETTHPNSGNQVIYWIGGFALLVFGIVFLSSLKNPLSNPQSTPENTQPQTIVTMAEETVKPSVTSTLKSDPTSEKTQNPIPLPTQLNEVIVSPTTDPNLGVGSTLLGHDGAVLVYVPEGEFMMGTESGHELEKPIHSVYLNAFWIDQNEVTNAMYLVCMQAGKCKQPSVTTNVDDVNLSNHPVTFVSWENARDYCVWARRRLPTEAEWEKAARGTDQRTYPWGEGLSCQKANYQGCEHGTTNVGSYPSGASPYGALDMAGNVMEWVGDWWNISYYSNSPLSNPTGPVSGNSRVIRGGSWNYVGSGYDLVGSAFRYGAYPDDTENYIGFRCVRDVNE